MYCLSNPYAGLLQAAFNHSQDENEAEKMKYRNFVKQIYENKINYADIDKLLEQLTNINITLGAFYTFIRQRLQIECRSYRMLLSDSMKMLSISMKKYAMISGTKLIPTQQELNLKFQQTAVHMIYNYYSTVAKFNKLACYLWEGLRNNQFIKNTINHKFKSPELKVSILNLLTLRELIPPSEHINLSDFKFVLTRLKKYQYLTFHSQIDELLAVFSQGDSQAKAEQENKQTTPASLKGKFIKDHENWIAKCKEDPVGRAFSSIIDSQQQKFKPKLHAQDIEDFANGLLPKRILGKKSEQRTPKCKQRIIQEDQFSFQTINFLKQLKIDNSTRTTCHLPQKIIQKWAQGQMSKN